MMKLLNSLSLATKLYAMGAFSVTVLLLQAFLGYQRIEEMSEGSKSMYKDRIIPLQQLRIMARIYALELPTLLNARSHKSITIERTQSELLRLQDSAKKTWADYLTSYLTPEEKKLADSTGKELAKSYDTFNKLQAMVNFSDKDSLRLHNFIDSEPFEKLARLLYQLSELQLQIAHELHQQNEAAREEYKQYTLRLMFIFFAILIIGKIGILHNIIPLIRKLHSLAHLVAEGNTSIRVKEDDRKDELGDLFRCFGKMVQNIDDNKKELEYQNATLEEQAIEIELMNTALNENNIQLNTMNSHLVELIHNKNTFIRIATHDLKNPLQSIIMSISLLRMYPEKLSREQFTQKIHSIEETVKRMNGIISSFLESNALEEGLLHLNIEKIRLDDIVNKITDDYQAITAKKNITLLIEDLKPHFILANRDTTQQCIENILSNAVKFSESQTTITVSMIENTQNHKVELRIQDQGPGLTEEDKEKLFIAFAKRSAKPTGGEASTGLGLSIVKVLMEGMGGSIRCESEIGKGSIFILEFRTTE